MTDVPPNVEEMLLWIPKMAALVVCVLVLAFAACCIRRFEYTFMLLGHCFVALAFGLTVMVGEVEPVSLGFWMIWSAMLLTVVDLFGCYKKEPLRIAERLMADRDARRENRRGKHMEGQKEQHHTA